MIARVKPLQFFQMFKILNSGKVSFIFNQRAFDHSNRFAICARRNSIIVKENKMTNFEDFKLSETLYKSLAKMDYKTPTDIQAQAIPLALEGKDILGSAQTGTGKTAAFAIPMVQTLLRDQRAVAVVLTPTRELAKQVLGVVNDLIGYQSKLHTAFIIGGEHMGKQIKQLRSFPRIIVGTPGRINDHLRRGSLKLDRASFLVLDETDRMLDMGFGVQLDEILTHMPAKRQTLMFSATLPDAIIAMSKKYMHKPARVSVGATNVIAPKIEQEVIYVDQDAKYKELVNQLHEREGSVIIFMKTKRAADRVAKNLNRDGFEAAALHGDLRQNKRTTVMRRYREKEFRILVATDIAARGLDVPHIEHVINHDLPQVPEDYIHRMGRTARAGAAGKALSLISPRDGRNWKAIMTLLDPSYKSASERRDAFVDGPRRKKKKAHKKKDTYKSGKPRRDVQGDTTEGKKAKKKYVPKHKRADQNVEHSGDFKKKKKKKPFKAEEKTNFKSRDNFSKGAKKQKKTGKQGGYDTPKRKGRKSFTDRKGTRKSA